MSSLYISSGGSYNGKPKKYLTLYKLLFLYTPEIKILWTTYNETEIGLNAIVYYAFILYNIQFYKEQNHLILNYIYLYT